MKIKGGASFSIITVLVFSLAFSGISCSSRKGLPVGEPQFVKPRKLRRQFKLKGIETPGCCFPAYCKVKMGDGSEIPIAKVQIGDTVLGIDPSTKKTYPTVVLALQTQVHTELYQLNFKEDTLVCTDDHPIWIEGKGWCALNPGKANKNYSLNQKVKPLRVGQQGLIYSAKSIQSVKLISVGKIIEKQPCYTITSLANGNSFIINNIAVSTEPKLIDVKPVN